MDLARIIFFTDRIDVLTAFYRRHFGLDVLTDEPEWKELKAGSGVIAFHAGSKGKPNHHTPKIAFRCDDVPLKRAELMEQGVPMGRLWTGEITFSDGVDPDGNAFQISDRASR